MFEGAYGIIVDDTPTESIRLKVDAYQANYLRSLPLHSSQHELKRTGEYSIFSLRVRPTYDFKQKLLSLGSTVEVLQPESLRADMRGEIQEMVKKYR
jgi:predicted DNA-binding transcriptional regulator YafY